MNTMSKMYHLNLDHFMENLEVLFSMVNQEHRKLLTPSYFLMVIIIILNSSKNSQYVDLALTKP